MGMTPFHGPPADPPMVPGFVASTLLGLGAHGAVWAAREQITGDVVALKIGRARAGDDAGSREADLLARLDHPHLIRLRRVITMPDGATALVLDLAAGGSMAALIAARGPLEPGEVVTLLIPLAGVLTELHAQGLVHGDLAPGNVLFSADGCPMLSDLGVSSILGSRTAREWSTPGFCDPAPSAGGRARDVWGLGAVAWFALTAEPPPGPHSFSSSPLGDQVPAPLQVLIRECLAEVPSARPVMASIAGRAWDAVPVVPIQLPHPSIEPGAKDAAALLALPLSPAPALGLVTSPSAGALAPDVSAQGRRAIRPTRRHLVAAILGSLLAGSAAAAFYATAPGGSLGPAVQKRDVSQSPASMLRVLDRIAAARAAAFEHVSLTPLASADEPGSAAMRMDADLVQRLDQAGLRLDGVSYQISEVHAVAATDDLLDVTALVTTSAHHQVVTAGGRPAGSTVRQVAAVGPQSVRLRLVRTDSGAWLVRTAESIPAPAAAKGSDQ